MNTGMYVFGGIPHEKLVQLYLANGINRTFIASEEENFDGVMKIYNCSGITVETLHAPFTNINDMWGEDENAGNAILARLFDSVDKCERYGIPVTIVHVSSGRPMPEINAVGVSRYERLFGYAERKGIKIALENLRYYENLKYFMDRYDSPVFCWDTGHENCYTDGISFMEHFGDRLGALHIHDNRCLKDLDEHMLPYDGNIDFEAVAKQIAHSGYKGTVMLEVGRNAKNDGSGIYAHLSDKEFIERATAAVTRLAARIEELSALR